MDNAPHRRDISDHAWEIIAPHLPGGTEAALPMITVNSSSTVV